MNSNISYCIFCALIMLYAPLNAQPTGAARFILPSVLNEASGLYYAGPDSLWWHNDGGDIPALYLTNDQGELLRTVPLPGLRNIDWEDITVDDQGFLYIGDFGNNLNQRKDLRIYRFHPPTASVDSILFAYEDQHAFPPPAEEANFDMEAMFWYGDTLHLFSKNRLQKGSYYTKHYTLPAAPGTYTARLRDSIYLRKRVVTGAAISPDGKAVALVAYDYRRWLGIFPTSAASVFVFTDFPQHRFLQGDMDRRRISCIFATQYEAVDFIDDEWVYVASERTIFIPPRVKRRQVRKKDMGKGGFLLAKRRQ